MSGQDNPRDTLASITSTGAAKKAGNTGNTQKPVQAKGKQKKKSRAAKTSSAGA
jgi:hypothetical protein